MTGSHIAVAVALAVYATAPTKLEVAACRPYALRYCKETPLDMRMVECLQAHRPQLGVLCRAALAAHGY